MRLIIRIYDSSFVPAPQKKWMRPPGGGEMRGQEGDKDGGGGDGGFPLLSPHNISICNTNDRASRRRRKRKEERGRTRGRRWGRREQKEIDFAANSSGDQWGRRGKSVSWMVKRKPAGALGDCYRNFTEHVGFLKFLCYFEITKREAVSCTWNFLKLESQSFVL